jgi:H2-forming N5,N10-methylenetetrahydromethanopterin dehydrogenase-like enzyme
MFDVNNLTAIANKITPKILRVIFIPFGPIIRSILEDVFKTIYITNTLTITAIIMFSV